METTPRQLTPSFESAEEDDAKTKKTKVKKVVATPLPKYARIAKNEKKKKKRGRVSNGIGVDSTTVCTAIGDDDDARSFVQYSSVAAKVASIAHVQRSNANV